MKLATRILAFLPLFAGLTSAAQTPLGTEAMGSRYRDDASVAADHLSRGLRFKGKAEKEQDAAKRAKFFDKARQELSKSVGLDVSYDALLALGQVYLALEQPDSAFNSCSQALQFRPGSEAARTCVEEAKKAGV